MVIFTYDQYLHFKNIWKEFNFNTFWYFHNHYLQIDVLLLADVFEKFISTSLKNYNLDPCHYFSAPGLPWDAMLKMTKEELEKISNADMHLFIEKGMRGGLVMLQKDIVKQIINIAQIIITKNLKFTLFTLTRIIYMDMQWVNIYHMEDLSGLKLIIKQ